MIPQNQSSLYFFINCMQLKLKACRMCTVVMKRYKNDQGRITILQIFGCSKRNIVLTKQCMFFLLFVVFSNPLNLLANK